MSAVQPEKIVLPTRRLDPKLIDLLRSLKTGDAIRLTQSAGWQPIVSARSGETEDAFISHLAVATNAGQLKVGSFSRSERMVKWNEVLRIQRELGSQVAFAKFNARGKHS